MIKYSVLLITVATWSSFVLASDQGMTSFLKSFPDKMTCKGVEVSALTNIRKMLTEKIAITISNKDSDQPMIEVIAPSATRKKHFKIGAGYGGSLEQVGNYSYYYISNNNGQGLYYVPVLRAGDEVTFTHFLRMRDAFGGNNLFSAREICTRGFNCIELSECVSE